MCPIILVFLLLLFFPFPLFSMTVSFGHTLFFQCLLIQILGSMQNNNNYYVTLFHKALPVPTEKK